MKNIGKKIEKIKSYWTWSHQLSDCEDVRDKAERVYLAGEVDAILRRLECEVSCRVWHGASPKQVMEAFQLILRKPAKSSVNTTGPQLPDVIGRVGSEDVQTEDAKGKKKVKE